MEILERGKLPSEKEYICTCRNCKTRFKFKQSEGRIHYDQRDGNHIEVYCPVCLYQVTTAL